MNEQLMSLSKIFTDRLFRIPDYQRGYAWTEKEVTDFWNDLCRLGEGSNHYVGVLTLESVIPESYAKWIDDLWLINSKNYSPYYVVDGQQRLTTSILLLTTIVDVMIKKNIPSLLYTSRCDIIKRFISESKAENCDNSYLFCYETENPSYYYLIHNVYRNDESKVTDSKETTYTLNLGNARNFFEEKLCQLDVDELEKVYAKITQRFLFNTYEISKEIDVFVTFETMNNRGRPLSQLELLKNRLIYISTLFGVDEGIRSRLRRDINACWKEIYHQLGINRRQQLPDDVFLLNFRTSQKQQINR